MAPPSSRISTLAQTLSTNAQPYGNLRLIGDDAMDENLQALGEANNQINDLQSSGLSREEIQERVAVITDGVIASITASVNRLRARATDYIYNLPGGMQKAALTGLQTIARDLKKATQNAIKFVAKVLKAVKKFASNVWQKVADLFNDARNACAF